MTVPQIIWCDHTHVLMVRCVNGTRQDWKLSSIGDPESWAKTLALDLVKSMGMPTENAIEYENGGPCSDVPDVATYMLAISEAVDVPFSELRQPKLTLI